MALQLLCDAVDAHNCDTLRVRSRQNALARYSKALALIRRGLGVISRLRD